jgi:hypothetical protein
MSFESIYKKYPRSASVLFIVLLPFLFVKVTLQQAPWGELGKSYVYIWKTLKTGQPQGL